MSARKWYGLVIHHTAGRQSDTIESVRAQHLKQKYADIGYHYFVEVDSKGRGHLKRGRSTELQGCHGNKHANNTMLGLCVAGNYEKQAMSDALYQDVLGAVLHVLKIHGVAAGKIVGHREIKATACPGKLFPLAALKADAADRLK